MDRLAYDQVSHSSPEGMYGVGGVNVYPTPITFRDQVNIIYDGLLSKSGAQDVYLHLGFGYHNNWHDTKYLKMFHTGRGWEQTVQASDDTRLNFCFKDGAGNWDNNSGHNWSYEIHDGKQY
ncbi:carbohydrate-binding protein [Phosphitispora sp. TUW77]|uniref:carbohydrate-binding protein n=1 Tax=Phosphitispora sp. TUW77 TaxID=3152361 RepID=UPI003AB7264E